MKLTKIYRVLRNKYLLAVLVAGIWLLVFDRNNLIDRFQNINTLEEMEDEKAYYLKRIEEDSKKLEELKTSDKNLEKFAREQYFMKKENEDVFVIIHED